MILPCPHCKSRFKLDLEPFPTQTVKLKCPSCDGLFAIQPQAAPNAGPNTPDEKTTSLSSTDRPLGKKEPVVAEGKKAPDKQVPARNTLTGWTVLIPAGILLLVLIGVLGIMRPFFGALSPKNIRPSSSQPVTTSPALPGLSPSASKSSTGSKTGMLLKAGAPMQISGQDDSSPFYQTLWPFSPVEIKVSCHRLLRFQKETLQRKSVDPRNIYPSWIAYLTLETSPVAICALESAFNLATDALQKKTDCSLTYAFLSAYYAHKRITDRSQIFLNEALQLSEKDPWVKIVEAYYYQKIRQTPKEAISILKKLIEKKPEFSLASYHLARLYMRTEEYEKADDLFMGLQIKFPDQDLFSELHQALDAIQNVPYYSPLMAGGLLNLSRAFTALRDYHIAGHLSRKALHEMPKMLSKDQQKTAYYHLGRIYEITGDKNKAYSAYLDTLKIDPAFQPARKNIQDLLPAKEHM